MKKITSNPTNTLIFLIVELVNFYWFSFELETNVTFYLSITYHLDIEKVILGS